MEARISLITLGVEDLRRVLNFYRDGLRWPLSSTSSDDVAFFRTGGVVLALYPRDLLAADANSTAGESGEFSGMTLAHNVAEREQVDAVLGEAVTAGATLVKPAEDVSWGGRSGYVADPDGHLWEVAWNPYFPFAPDGGLDLPV